MGNDDFVEKMRIGDPGIIDTAKKECRESNDESDGSSHEFLSASLGNMETYPGGGLQEVQSTGQCYAVYPFTKV